MLTDVLVAEYFRDEEGQDGKSSKMHTTYEAC